jgi:CRP/FNR family cyclic AMP-dependent transcriptional regulator
MKPLTLIDKAFFLKQTPLFGSLDLNLLLAIADKLGLVAYEDQEDILVKQEDAKRMYFIVKGKIEIYSSKDQWTGILQKGDFFGEESLFNDSPREYTARSLTPTHLLTLSRTNLYTIISECPSVAVGFLQVYTSFIQCRPVFFPGKL